MTVARHILFSAPMVRALLDGRKLQTRRIVKPQPPAGVTHCAYLWRSANHPEKPHWQAHWMKGPGYIDQDEFIGNWFTCPYGLPGDLLWVRETWAPRTLGNLPHLDGVAKPRYRATEELRPEWGNAWRPSIHMPRWASRLTLTITDVRVERLQDISEADARAEGIHEFKLPNGSVFGYDPQGTPGWAVSDTAVGAYAALWEHINGKGSWRANPWVWVPSFTAEKRNVDEVLRRAA